MIYFTRIESPIGPLMLTSNGEALTGLFMEPHRHGPASVEGWTEDAGAAPFPLVITQLAEYFAGQRARFEVPLAGAGTEFQRRVWSDLMEIGFGETRSYGEMARRLGKPGASRAVGLANGRNPISIIVPCHRVIGANGTPTGYGGGLPRKVALLEWEKRVCEQGPCTMPHCG